ncbi:phospholipase A [Luteimonas sp. A649]
MNTERQQACIGLFFCTVVATVHDASAQTPPSSLAQCHAIQTSAERLACYDASSDRPADAADAAGGVGRAQPAAAIPAAAESAESWPDDVLAQAIDTERTADATTSMIDAAWDFDPSTPNIDIRLYRANYLLPVRYSSRVNNQPFTPLFEAAGVPQQELDHVEAKFQLSFKGRLWSTDDRRWGVWVGYTQQSQWQVFNDNEVVSRPFRETNYMPELFLSYRPGVELPGGFHWGLLNVGLNHQSNGRAEPLSRSWDRAYAEFAVERGNLVLSATVWSRFEEDYDEDDNLDITDYYGNGEFSVLYRWRGQSFAASLRGNPGTGKGAVQFGWTSRPLFGAFRGYAQIFSGYGESLIDYNWNQTTIGVGIALNDGL